MKLLAIVVLLSCTLSIAQTVKQDVSTKGACSPNVIQNKSQIKFTCDVRLDNATIQKLNRVLNEVISKDEQSSDVSSKLDEILNFIHQQAPRDISDEQKSKFLKIVGTNDKGSIRMLVVAQDSESFQYSRKIGALLEAGGWKVEYRGGFLMNGDPSGIAISVADKDSPNAGLLQHALNAIGISAPGEFQDKQEVPILIRVGGKPTTR